MFNTFAHFRLKFKHGLLLWAGMTLCFGGRAEQNDTVFSVKRSSFVDAYSLRGTVFNTNDFVSDIPDYQAFSLRFARASNGSSWEDIAYGMPFFGVGVYAPFFTNNPGLGNPFSIYMFRGNTLSQFSDNLALVFEWSLGLSMNWKPYDPFDNPDNQAIGSSNNTHVGARLYLEYFLFKNWDLKLGVDLTHTSNGSSRLPNLGINMGGVSLSLAHTFNPPQKGLLLRNTALEPPEIPLHINHETQFIFSNRQTRFSTNGTNLPSPFIDKHFKVLGLAYSPLIVKGYKYKWGPSVHFTYDESSNAKAWRELNPVDNQWYERVALADFSDRLNIGLGLKGEISMPIVSVFATIGYSVYHKHHSDKRLFQILGVKAYLKDNFFGTFGISATDFSKAQYLYWSFGYTYSAEDYRLAKQKRS